MLQVLKRSIKQYIPNDSVIFNSQGKRLLFQYHDDRVFKESIFIAVSSSLSCLGYSYLYQSYFVPLIGFFVGSLSCLSTLKSASQTVSSVYMLQDGKNIEISTFSFFNRKKTLLLPIDKIESVKGKNGFKIYVDKHTYLLEQEGKILDIHLFFAVLRKLNIDNSNFRIEKNENITTD